MFRFFTTIIMELLYVLDDGSGKPKHVAVPPM